MKAFFFLTAFFITSFVYAAGDKEINSTALFAAGCFWSVENNFEKLEGVIEVNSGFTGGSADNPTYKNVCSGTTGHAEAVEVIFDPAVISYEELVRFFFTTHDFTNKSRGSANFVSQYRSEIFYKTEAEMKTALKIKKEYEDKGYSVFTDITPAGKFWMAEEYHQDYIKKIGRNNKNP